MFWKRMKSKPFICAVIEDMDWVCFSGVSLESRDSQQVDIRNVHNLFTKNIQTVMMLVPKHWFSKLDACLVWDVPSRWSFYSYSLTHTIMVMGTLVSAYVCRKYWWWVCCHHLCVQEVLAKGRPSGLLDCVTVDVEGSFFMQRLQDISNTASAFLASATLVRCPWLYGVSCVLRHTV